MISVFGIRHHGPGSARSLQQTLESLRPDIVLVEGPPDADELIPLAAHREMTLPVALLIYLPDQPQHAVYYPFTEFSPEWQAIQFALAKKIPVRFMDLPQANQLSANGKKTPGIKESEIESQKPEDPFTWIAEASGYTDGERWWEHFVEQRRESRDVFQGILELMSALREEMEKTSALDKDDNALREASMRTIIRAAQAEGFQNIAVVCGAWHAPKLLQPENFKKDARLLKGLTSTQVSATWVPWTYNRLTRISGYGAGIESPGWYEHIWETKTAIVEKWMVKVAHAMRAEDLGISPAHAIEATRLAETLAALRESPLPGLMELNEVVRAVFCFGDDAPLRLVHEKLIVGTRMGKVPPNAPSVPLQLDLFAAQKRTRLEPSASPETLDLDLRKPLLLERSRLLHRLNVLGIPWGQLATTRGAKGTFRELWQIEWKPEFAVNVIEASLWGNTVLDAAANKIEADAHNTNELPALTRLVESALLADLANSIPGLMGTIQKVAATSGDISHLMQALPPLANVLRYGNVRQTDTSMIRQVVDELMARICIGLPSACSALSDDAAGQFFEHINAVQNAVGILQDDSHTQAWLRALEHLASQDGVHGLIRGRACRLLFDRSRADGDTARQMSLALSPGTPTSQAAAWVQGFLHGSGLALIHHASLWQLVNQWVLSLSNETFISILPLLRRTFSTFPAGERRQIGELAKTGGQVAILQGENHLDISRVEKVLPLLIKILGEQQEAA
jgi:Family of unknown function (DUF5682)